MNKIKAILTYFAVFIAAAGFLSSCTGKSMDRMLVITRAAADQENLFYNASDSLRASAKSQIAIIDPSRPENSLKILSTDYYSARSPQISYDGKFMLFAGKQNQNDPWQIWEMNINDLKARKVVDAADNCIDPVYLPGGRILFSRNTTGDSIKAGYSIYTCNIDGSKVSRITFNPHSYKTSNVLRDGRVFTTGVQVYPVAGNPSLMVMRPDGTKAELFYKSPENSRISGPVHEAADGNLFFIESPLSNPGKGSVICISYNRPLHSRIDLSAGIDGDFNGVYPQRSGTLLVSFRKSENERYSLYEFKTETKSLGKAVYSDREYDIMEVVESGVHERPKKLPSEVDMGVKTGLIMCQDINEPNQYGKSLAKSSRVEVVGIDSVLGSFQVEEDGSMYMKVLADKPFRIRTIDSNGKVTNDPCGWIWLRPNERRGCVGCHENPEIVPENRIPLAVKKSPVVIPMHINKVVEKKVSLE
jgi:hypothetical protein